MSDIEREEFEREERYIVVKINRLEDESEIALREFLQSWQIDTEQCVVVEHDWPNYEHTWDTIQQVADGTWQSSRQELEGEAVGTARRCGYDRDITYCDFEADEVPIGTKLYTHPASSDEWIKRSEGDE